MSINYSAVTPALLALFTEPQPADLRLRAILTSAVQGNIFTDNPTTPTWAVVQEIAFGTLYIGGNPDSDTLHQLITQLRRKGDVLFGFWNHETRYLSMLPTTEYDGRVMEFTQRTLLPHVSQETIPPTCRLRRVDECLFQRSDHSMDMRLFGSMERALANCLGLCLMQDEAILCEAFASVAHDNLIEIGVETREMHRRKGYAILTCARLIQACEALGYATYWNCAAQNMASVHLARKLGYQNEREYRLWVWGYAG